MGGMETDEENKFLALLQTLDQMFGIEEKWESVKQYGREHPVTTLFTIVTFCICCIPIFCFAAFAFGSAVLTFSAFVFIEGTILTVGTLVLGGVLFFVGLMSVGISIFFVTTFYTFQMAQKLINKFSCHQDEQAECDSSTKQLS